MGWVEIFLAKALDGVNSGSAIRSKATPAPKSSYTRI